ncbi:MAG: hypothetical protein ACOYT9_01545 [Patescibacteria group bacterium]
MEGLRITKIFKRYRLSGSGAVEIILAISIFMAYATFLIGALTYSISTTKIPNTQKTAIRYASEGAELLRYIRKDALTNLPNGTYGFSFNGTDWILSGSSESLEGGIYTRSVTITAPTVERKLATVTVSWNNAGRTGSESVITMLTNWQDIITPPTVAWQTPVFNKNHAITRTAYDVTYLKFYGGVLYALLLNGSTTSYFTSFDVSAFPTISQGSNVNLNAVHTDVGHRYLAGDGIRRFYYSSANNTREVTGIDASTRNLIGTLNMSGNIDTNGITANGDTLYVARTANRSTAEFNILQNTGTTTYTAQGVLQSSATYYDVLVRDNTYVYVTTSNTAQELHVIDVSNTAAPSLDNTVNLPTTITGRFDMIVSGDVLILYRRSGTVTGSQIYFYDVSTPNSPTYLGAYTAAYLIYDADVDPARSFLFLATASATNEFEVVDFSTPTAPVRRGLYNASASTYRSVAWDSVNDRAYIGTTDNTNEIVILDAE